MDFSFIVPEAHLELAALTHHHIILPTYYVKSRPYQEFCKEMRGRGDFLLLDNGFHEYSGGVLSWRGLLDIANDLDPTVIVMPEFVQYDPHLLLYNLSWCHFIREKINSKWEFCYIPRSTWLSDLEEELSYLREVDSQHLITWLGLHKDMERFAQGNMGGRRAVVLGLKDVLEGYKIHMLGIYKNPIGEIRSFQGLPNVYGSDSRKPWRICCLGRLLSEFQALPSGFEFFGSVNGDVLGFVERQFQLFIDKEVKVASSR